MWSFLSEKLKQLVWFFLGSQILFLRVYNMCFLNNNFWGEVTYVFFSRLRSQIFIHAHPPLKVWCILSEEVCDILLISEYLQTISRHLSLQRKSYSKILSPVTFSLHWSTLVPTIHGSFSIMNAGTHINNVSGNHPGLQIMLFW